MKKIINTIKTNIDYELLIRLLENASATLFLIMCLIPTYDYKELLIIMFTLLKLVYVYRLTTYVKSVYGGNK